MARSVFYSFHFKRDVHRVQLVRQINALEGQPLLNAQAWETVRAGGKTAIEKWIDSQMAYKKALIVLIGYETASSDWVKYEIKHAWSIRKPILGIYIHGLSSMGVPDRQGRSPFNLAAGINTFDPTTRSWTGAIDTKATYNKLRNNLESWSRQGTVRRG